MMSLFGSLDAYWVKLSAWDIKEIKSIKAKNFFLSLRNSLKNFLKWFLNLVRAITENVSLSADNHPPPNMLSYIIVLLSCHGIFLLQFVFFCRWGVLKNTRDIVKSEAFVGQRDIRDKWKTEFIFNARYNFCYLLRTGSTGGDVSFRLLRFPLTFSVDVHINSSYPK